MPKFVIEALEKFTVRTTYVIEADTPEEAEARAKSGKVAYDDSEIQEGNDEWLETVSVDFFDDAGT